MPLKNLIIVGAGGFGREVAVWCEGAIGAGTEWLFKGFLDDDFRNQENERHKFNVATRNYFLGGIEDFSPDESDLFVCAIADPVTRKSVVDRLKCKGGRFTNFIHSTVLMSKDLEIGQGNIFCPYVTVTCGARFGDFNIFNSKTSIGHDVRMGSFNSVMGSCNLGGGSRLGDFCFLGTQSVLLPNVMVQDRAKVGIGSVVIRTVPAGITVFGCPAKRVT